MKGYKFKLEALLKIRKLNEDQCKLEIGRLQVEKGKLEDIIRRFDSELSEMYEAQETTLEEGVSGQQARFFPFFFEGKRAHVDQIYGQINELNTAIEAKYIELKQLRANVKVLEKMKEKDMRNYKLKLNRKINNEIEENVMNWKQSQQGNKR
jgi:flagellar export protein FliJ